MSTTMRQFNSSPCSGELSLRVHSDGRAIHDGIKKFTLQIGALYYLVHPRYALTRVGMVHAPRANANDGARLRQRKGRRSRRASRPKQQHSASREAHPPLQAAQYSDVIRIVPVQSPAATHHQCIDRAYASRQRIAVVQKAQNRFLVRNSYG